MDEAIKKPKRIPKYKIKYDRTATEERVNRNLKRLFHNRGVLNNADGKAHVEASVKFYLDKFGERSNSTQIAAIIYSEHAIKHFRGSVAGGCSALWNSVYAAYRGIPAVITSLVVAGLAAVFIAACASVLLFISVLVVLFAAAGLLYVTAGVMGLGAHFASALAFTGVGLASLGVFLLFIKPIISLVRICNYYISIPIFALSICVRQIAREKRQRFTSGNEAVS
jgi:hypothetical protein